MKNFLGRSHGGIFCIIGDFFLFLFNPGVRAFGWTGIFLHLIEGFGDERFPSLTTVVVYKDKFPSTFCRLERDF